MKISVIFGTRPEAIKLAPVILAAQREVGIVCRVCVTAQHREMLDQVLEVFDIRPDADLGIMRPNQSLAELTARATEAINSYLKEEKPDLIVVQGDTTTTFVASLMGFYHHIPVAHVEAGLRTGNLKAPWPEEANRVLTTRLASLHLAPTEANRRNLLSEGISPENIFVTGNTVIDALLLAVEKVKKNPPAIPGLEGPLADRIGKAPLVLITGHRRESFGDGFRSICRAIGGLAKAFPAVDFAYPVHMNPNVRSTVGRMLGDGNGFGNVHLLDPLPYLPFVALMNRATLILTDSGGIQEEAPSLGKPVLVMRETTERSEAVEAGTAKLVGMDAENIFREVSRLLTDPGARRQMARNTNPFGDGKASERIVGIIKSKTMG